MGCYDGAEVCDLAGIFILNKLINTIDKNSIGLYRDDGLGMFDKIRSNQSSLAKDYRKICHQKRYLINLRRYTNKL